MQNLTILNKKQIKKILQLLNKQFGFKEDLNYVFLQNKDGKIFIINKSIGNLDLNKLRINSIGLYFCKLEDDGLRMSIEGSQIIGNQAKKNLVELNEKQIKEWIAGKDLERKGFLSYVLIKHKKDFLGCGKAKENKILNFVPKTRRIKV